MERHVRVDRRAARLVLGRADLRRAVVADPADRALWLGSMRAAIESLLAA